MITNEEVRQLMYAWHGGQATMLYQAASSGLVSDWQNLSVNSILSKELTTNTLKPTLHKQS